MQQNKFLFILAFILFTIVSCKKDTTESVSKITVYPKFTMTGDKYISIVKGGTYVEPGISAKEGDQDLTVTTSGEVDVNTVGIYDLVYSAENKDGFEGTITRTVAVLPSEEMPNVNIAGHYANTGTFNYVATITKLAPGFYLADNIWGMNSAAVIASYILTVNGRDLILPENEAGDYGRVQGSAIIDDAGNLTYVVSLLDLGVNNSTRKWIRQ